MFIEKIEKDHLLNPLQKIIGIVERKQPLPILSNVLIQKTGSNIHFVATDLEIQITTQLTDVNQTGSDTAITVAAKKLQEILKVLPEGSKVTLDVHESRLLVKVNKSKFTLQTLPAQDFPKVSEQLEQAVKIQIEQDKLKKLLGMVQYAMAQQDIRYYLNGVLLVIDGHFLKLIATDGHRLAYVITRLDQEYPKREIILPRKTVNELIKLLVETEEKITFELAENQVRMIFSNIILISKVIDGKFPDYERVIPNYTNQLTLNRIEILQALQRAAILSNEKFRGVRFVLTEKNLRIISNNSEQEEAQEDMEIDYQGIALDVGFNVNYLMDGLNNAATQTVIFSFGDANSSILITIPGNEEFKYVVMPMRI
ncbi:DNA polymerase III subunit beta [Candidatus Nitrotoga sp. AM1P]|uniref:DNA polymerase III subunit beta n=1 Tax=Candidatus Nitrotoga sp. AM1P TaxID=2559597 RepID=UPI0010B5028F|nr:DNA polymerase III subunit beta [Candidatus Nitrotoga sp. AM1P]BBJ23936.1 DNA polymerase III subunit beta [Candidatus Nitrotoga sp. AM1P]